ncbi:MAG TPA: type II toxin-antitoxin system Phd/YefM family antitoxin [Phycisphaerales bacterium]|nr:type II toxin-antitoxin system Phd/YefM family antitoxin [Phycisphaerales bacterium]
MYTPPSLPDTQALTEFRENTAAVLKRLARTDRPLLLTQKGKAAGIVMSTRVYEQLADAAALSQSIEAVRRGLKEFNAGKARPAAKALAALERKLKQKTKD